MVGDNAPTAGPKPADFLGQTRTLALKRLFHAARPKFFPASILPVIAGSAWGYMIAQRFDALVFVLALFATVCVHAGANVLNDVGDDFIGTDRRNDDRIYPYTGGSRFIQSGIMTIAGMTKLGIGFFAIAAVAGLALLSLKGITILWFGFVGTVLAVLYSLGPMRLSSLGLGETTVAVAFGVLPVSGAAWLQSGVIDTSLILFSLPISMWVAAILLINEVPDIAADAAAGKRTLAVRLGVKGTALLYATIHLIAAGVVTGLSLVGTLPLGGFLIPAALLIPASRAALIIRRGTADRKDMTRAIEATLGVHTIGCIWLTSVVIYAALSGS